MFELKNSSGSYSFVTLYSFSFSDGAYPAAGLLMDSSGNLYGTTVSGGNFGQGSIFKLQYSGGTYTYISLYGFGEAVNSAGSPNSPLVMDAAGDLFGTTKNGGAGDITGTVFELPSAGGGSYSSAVNILHSFNGSDGYLPLGVAVDSSGNVYGTTDFGGPAYQSGGNSGNGTVFELPLSGGTYGFTTLYNFMNGNDGQYPVGPPALDSAGNLYGLTETGGLSGSGGGTVYKISKSGSSWSETTVYTFNLNNSPTLPVGSILLSPAGNLYGVLTQGGTYGLGAVFQLSPGTPQYQEQILYSFNQPPGTPSSGLITDSLGDLYGISNGVSLFTTPPGDGYIWELQSPYASSTTTQLTASPNPAYTDQQITFTARVSVLPSTATLAGSVTFSKGTTNLGTVNLSSGSASLQMAASTLGTGNSTVTAVFNSSVSNQVGSSASVQETVQAATTSLALTSSANPVFQGGTVTFTASLTSVPSSTSITGTVTFYEGPTLLSSVTVANNSASLTISASTLSVGSDTISAQFTPTGQFQATSGSMVETVDSASDIAILNGSNTFTGNQTVNGTVTASNFSCAGCIGNTQLGILYAGGDAKGGNAVNALKLGGQLPSFYANVDSNSFTGDQSITGNLVTTGNVTGAGGKFSGTVSSAGVAVAPIGTAMAGGGFKSGPVDTAASLYNSNSGAAQNADFRWQAEPVASTNNTASPAATLNLLYGSGGAPAETGLSVNANGTLNFASGQTFPGAGGIAAVTAASGSGLSAVTTSGDVALRITGGGVTNGMLANSTLTVSTAAGSGLAGGGSVPLGGSLSLSLAPNVCSPGSAVSSQQPFACSPFVTSGSGANVSFGTVAATSFSGSGAGLTALDPAKIGAGTAGISITGNAATATTANSAVTANNALNLGGNPASSFATLGANSFAADQTVGGNLLASGNVSGAAGKFAGDVSSGGLALAPGGTATSAQGFNSGALDASASLFNSTAAAAQNMMYRWQAEPVAASNNTASPAATLNLLYGANGAPSETGLSVNADGTLNFAHGQTFPGTGDVTGVTAGAGLTGGGTSGNVSLSIPSGGVTNGMLANSSVTIPTGAGLTGGGAVALGGSSQTIGIASAGVTNGMLANSSIVVGTAAGSGLTGGGSVPLGGSLNLAIPAGGVTNSQLANPSVTITAGSGLSGGGNVNLGGTTSLSIGNGAISNAQLSNSSLTLSPGAGLTGGGSIALGATGTLAIANSGVTNAMLANPSVTITPGSGLTGGGTVSLGGTTTLALASNTCPAGSAVTAEPFACSPFLASGANASLGNVTATSFSGNGSALTSLNPANLAAGTANINISGNAATASAAGNASTLGGNVPGYYAALSLPNIFTANQSMPSLNVTGAAQAASVTATSSLTIGGGTPITQYVSVTDTITLPAIKASDCKTFMTAALTGFTPGTADTIALGVPGSLQAGLPGSGIGHPVFLTYQAWETSSTTSTTMTLQVCNPSGSGYTGGNTGTVSIDVFKH